MVATFIGSVGRRPRRLWQRRPFHCDYMPTKVLTSSSGEADCWNAFPTAQNASMRWKRRKHYLEIRAFLRNPSESCLPLSSYLGAFHEDTKTEFNRSFEESEANSVIDILTRIGLSPTQTSPSAKSLSDVPSAVVYRMLANFGVFQDARILSIVDKYPPSVPLRWPLDILPAGILLLLLHRNPLVRDWATKQTAKCTIVPIPNEAFNGPYSEVLKVIAFIYSPPSTTTIPSMANLTHLRAFFVAEPISLWSSFLPLLKLIPPESLVSGTFQHVDIRRVLVAHLHDTGPGR